MNESRRMLLSAAVLVIVAVAAVGWSGSRLSGAADAAASAAADRAACERLAGEIDRLRQRPTVAAGDGLQPIELSRRLKEAIDAAGLDADALTRVAPEPARRLGDTDYQLRPTRLQLHAVTLRELIAFATTLAGPGSGLSVSELHLSVPGVDAGGQPSPGDTWDVEMSVAALVYAPREKAATPQRRADAAEGM